MGKARIKFEEYIIPYNATGDSSNEIRLSDVISEDDIYYIERVNKPIITKTAIAKIIRYFNFIEKSPRIDMFDYKTNDGIITIICTVCSFLDPNKNVEFFGDGEASPANLDNNISGAYPVALAIKRAKARAILSYIGLDMYSEDEAESFKKPLDLTKEQIHEIGISQIRPILAERIKHSSEFNSLSKEELLSFVQKTIYLASNGKIKLSDQIKYSQLTVEDLLNVYVAMEINNRLSPDDMGTYLNSLASDASKEAEISANK